MTKLLFGQEITVFEWREQEHEDMDRDAMGDIVTLQYLQRYLKFYCMSNMHAQVHLLETLVSLWDHELGLFDLQGENLELTIEDIYFIMILSCRGAHVNPEGTG